MDTALLHSAFYQFASVPDPADAARAVRHCAQALCGSVVLAREGVNGVVAGRPSDIEAFEQALRALPAFEGQLARMAFKRSACRTRPFARLSVRVRPEIVAFGVPGAGGPAALGGLDAGHLGPAQWRDLMARDDVVLLDNRNSFEYRLGRFRGAIDPGVRNFREFAGYVQAHAAAWRAARRPVAMYCTGGIRCEKTSAWMRDQGLQVYQLEGGILNYFQTLPDADQDWQGECFVFDNRIALDTRLRETGATAEQVFDPALPDEGWRLARARRLDADADADEV